MGNAPCRVEYDIHCLVQAHVCMAKGSTPHLPSCAGTQVESGWWAQGVVKQLIFYTSNAQPFWMYQLATSHPTPQQNSANSIWASLTTCSDSSATKRLECCFREYSNSLICGSLTACSNSSATKSLECCFREYFVYHLEAKKCCNLSIPSLLFSHLKPVSWKNAAFLCLI